MGKYFQTKGENNWTFSTTPHQDTPIKRHVKVKGKVSPFNGDWAYWSNRRGQYPTIPPRVSRLLKLQKGRCKNCHLFLNSEDVVEVHHVDGNHRNNRIANIALIHGHCHDEVHRSVHDKDLATEEPDDGKLSRPVLKTSRLGD